MTGERRLRGAVLIRVRARGCHRLLPHVRTPRARPGGLRDRGLRGGADAYLVYVQVAVLHALCQWCLLSDLLLALLVPATLLRLRETPNAAEAGDPELSRAV